MAASAGKSSCSVVSERWDWSSRRTGASLGAASGGLGKEKRKKREGNGASGASELTGSDALRIDSSRLVVCLPTGMAGEALDGSTSNPFEKGDRREAASCYLIGVMASIRLEDPINPRIYARQHRSSLRASPSDYNLAFHNLSATRDVGATFIAGCFLRSTHGGQKWSFIRYVIGVNNILTNI
jgi:hypothetical protein